MEDRLKDLAVISENRHLIEKQIIHSGCNKSVKSKSSKKKKEQNEPPHIDDVFRDEYKKLCEKLESIRTKFISLEKESAAKIECIAKNSKFSNEKLLMLKSEIAGSINDFHSKLLALSELVSQDGVDSANDSKKRMKKMLLSSLSAEFKQLFQEFEEVQNQATDQYSRIVKHQIKVTNPDVVFSEDKPPSELLLSELLMDNLTEDGLRLVNERHLRLRTIEQELLEVQQMYIGIAELVDIQGEKINSIESYIDNTKMAMEFAHKDLVMAYKHKKKIRKKKILLVSLVASAFISLGAIFSGVFVR